MSGFKFDRAAEAVASKIRKEILTRLEIMVELGMPYLQLGRTTLSLSGGEAQRVRLAAQVGARLRGVLYVLDEPTVGLHQRDNGRLIRLLRAIRDEGNYRRRRRARRTDHPRRRPHPGPRPGGGRRGRLQGRRRHSRRDPGLGRFPDVPVPSERQVHPGARQPPRAARLADRGQGERTQPQGPGRQDPAGGDDGRHRRLRLRQEHARLRYSLQERSSTSFTTRNRKRGATRPSWASTRSTR